MSYTGPKYNNQGADGGGTGGPDGMGTGRPRNQHRRPVTDYGSPCAKWMLNRKMEWRGMPQKALQPNPSYVVDLLPPKAYPENNASFLPTKHIHASLNKIKHPINVVRWTPEGRRLLTGSNSGEFTLWNGMAFNFETIMQAHDCAIRACEYSHGADWLLSGDHDGIIKYWQPNFNNVKILQAHKEAIRDLSFSPTDAKFVTASDDGNLKVWNFNEGEEERVLSGHGWDVKCVDWHPSKGLIVSGSKDHLVKLWDPRVARCLTTFHSHKNTVSKAKFQPTRGDLLATCARDQTCRIFDLRAMKEYCMMKGYEKDISMLAWHPVNPALLSCGGSDGSLHHYLLNQSVQSNGPNKIVTPSHSIPHAHEYTIWAMEYHPLGHILCTGSNDRVTRFWARPRPGETDSFNDRYHKGDQATDGNPYDKSRKNRAKEEDVEGEDDIDALVDQKMPVAGQNLPPGFSETFQPPLPGSLPLGMGGPDGPMLALPGLGNIANLEFLQAAGLPPPPPPPPIQFASTQAGGNVPNPFLSSNIPINLDRLQHLMQLPQNTAPSLPGLGNAGTIPGIPGLTVPEQGSNRR